jgi:thiamine-monophosphate kinase
MKLSRIGEFGAIEKIAEWAAKGARQNRAGKAAGGAAEGAGGKSKGAAGKVAGKAAEKADSRGDFLKTGIGDDAAVFKVKAGYECLLSTDLLIEGIHFDLSYTGPKDLGYKALAANLSDIAAMGGEPLLYFVSIAAPGEMDFRDFKRIFAGMEEAAQNARLAGGDTCNTPGPLFISVSVIGQVEKGRAVKRSGAKPGDGIWVTGTLGDSAAGLEILKGAGRGEQVQSGWMPSKARGHTARMAPPRTAARAYAASSVEKYLISRHLRPEARVKAGRLLSNSGIASSMIDISDGLSSDLRHITEVSGAGAVIFEEKLPISRELAAYAGRERAIKLSLSGGEDYELLFTVRGPEGERRLSRLGDKAGVTFTKIGEVLKGDRAYLELENGIRKALKPEGYEHFE